MKRKIFTGFIPACFFAGILFFGCNSNEKESKPASTEPSTPEVKSIFINNDSLHYIEIGKGEPVIFIHGTLGDYRTWGFQIDTFAKNYRVIRSEEHTSELQSQSNLVCRLLLEKKKKQHIST